MTGSRISTAPTVNRSQLKHELKEKLSESKLYGKEQSGGAFLHVNLEIYASAFHLTLSYNKILLDPETETMFPAATYTLNAGGGHGGDSASIFQTAEDYITKFVGDYEQANRQFCK